MSWLARSLANSLNLDDVHDDAVPRSPPNDAESVSDSHPRDTGDYSDEDHHRSLRDDSDGNEDPNQGRGVKEDLSELKENITRQFWGVASFLAPPPPPPPPPPPVPRGLKLGQVFSDSIPDRSESENEEFDESVNCSQSQGYDSDTVEEAVGITEEVLAFARNIAHHPETWLDFPLEEEDLDDFDLSDAQYRHALTVEHLAPRLAALRIEFCPTHMSEGYFWMVYFVLLHSRINKHDADLLSSAQLLQARTMWMQELQKRSKEDSHWLGTSTFHLKKSAESSPRDIFTPQSNENASFGRTLDTISPFESALHHMTAQHDTEKHPYNEIEFIDKSVIREDPLPKLEDKDMVVGPSTQISWQDYDDDDDDWLKDDEDLVALSGPSNMVNEEDISFSDLEDDIDFTMPVKTKMASTEHT